VLNSANEVAVAAFLAGRLSFPGIAELVERVLDAHEVQPDPDLEQVLAADAWARERSRLWVAEGVKRG
ncbi:MAG: 1-deoxy-D-xylulose-5-phosphate reductoisomerase, partial [Firmicutes bacterium]|nr:1-deoxy-D-xylulose-5-phosphate reductoisomerase [Bacillota bacterium]